MHKALDKAGAVFGPLMAYGLLSWLGESSGAYQVLFWAALVPALLSLVVLALMKDQPGTPHAREGVSTNWEALSPDFKRFLVPAGVFALGYFSLGFLLLKAHAMGFSLTDTVLLYALFNGVCVVSAPMVGRLGDAMGRRRVVLLGYGLYGVFYAVEESQSKAFIADLEPDRRASAMGAYKFVTGLLYLPASLVAGALWTLDPRLAFGQAALLAVAAIALFVRMRPAAPLVVKSSH